jgi:hypothetical protein
MFTKDNNLLYMESIFIINKIGTKMIRCYDIGNQGKTPFFISPGWKGPSSPINFSDVRLVLPA